MEASEEKWIAVKSVCFDRAGRRREDYWFMSFVVCIILLLLLLTCSSGDEISTS